MTNVIDRAELFTSRKRHHEERAALISCTHIKEHLNNHYRGGGLSNMVYTPEDMEREQDRQRRLTYAACFGDLKDWTDRLRAQFPNDRLVEFIVLDAIDKLLMDWATRAK